MIKQKEIPFLPDAILDTVILTTGVRGNGKSHTSRVMQERAVTLNHRVHWIDAMGNAWGIRAAANGNGDGMDVLILGGDKGDIPITEGSGAVVGKFLNDAPKSCIVDISRFPSATKRRRFMLALLEALYEGAREPLIAIFDEVDLWAPQNMTYDEDPHLVGVMDEIVRRGRPKGLIPWMITQRPAAVNKRIMSQAETIISHKLTMDHDKKAIAPYFSGQEGGAELVKALDGLNPGEAIVRCTTIKNYIGQWQFPHIVTFDSFKTPKRGQKAPNPHMAAVQVDRLKAALATVEEEVKANDPRALKQRVAELERALTAKAPAAPALIDRARVLAEGFDNGYGTGFADGWVSGFPRGYNAATEKVVEASRTLNLDIAIPAPPAAPRRKTFTPVTMTVSPSSAMDSPRTARALTAMGEAAVAAIRGPSAPNGFGKAENAVLRALAQRASMGFKTATREQVALLAGYHPNTKSFQNALSGLRSSGLIENTGGGESLTDEGRQYVTVERMTPAQMVDALRKNFDGAQTKLFDALLAEDMDREALAMSAGYHPNTKSFQNALSRLNSLTITTKRDGKVSLSDWVTGAAP